MGLQEELYQQLILDHNRKPKNFFEMKDFTHSSEGFNPLCGDHIWVYLKISPKGKIESISFTGESCAICKASSSLMTEALLGKTISNASEFIQTFKDLLKGEEIKKDQISLGKLKIFSNIWKYPMRIKCAALPWHTVKGAMEDSKQVSTEN